MTPSQSRRYSDDALTCLEQEANLLREEQRAFRRFRKFVATQTGDTEPVATHGTSVAAHHTPVATQDTPVAIHGHSMATPSSHSTGLQHIRDRYRELVMDVIEPGGESQNSIDTHLEGELTAELSAALRHHTVFTPQLRGSLLATITAAHNAREDVLEFIRREREAVARQRAELDALDDEFSAIETRYGETDRVTDLVSLYESLEAVESRCEAVVQTRQRQLQTLSFSGPIERQDIHEYLYRDLDVTYPVLAETTGVATKSHTLKERIERRIATIE
ncbi:hypothetical protein ACLI4R_08770 [Natrialbaceae archaeon A-chndr2]